MMNIVDRSTQSPREVAIEKLGKNYGGIYFYRNMCSMSFSASLTVLKAIGASESNRFVVGECARALREKVTQMTTIERAVDIIIEAYEDASKLYEQHGRDDGLDGLGIVELRQLGKGRHIPNMWRLHVGELRSALRACQIRAK